MAVNNASGLHVTLEIMDIVGKMVFLVPIGIIRVNL